MCLWMTWSIRSISKLCNKIKNWLGEEEVEAIKDEYYDDGWKAAKREAVSAVESI